MSPEILSLLGLGFFLGMLHALDADHVMAVSTLSLGAPSLGRTLRFCANWGIGHGGVLLSSGVLLFGLGLKIPVELQQLAEAGVGVLLIGLGLWCFWSFRQRRLSLEAHAQDDLVHRHGHQPADLSHRGQGRRGQSRQGHAPVMVGMLHGLAGSAPALALIPALAQGHKGAAFAYLLVFSSGVLLSMLAFGLGWGALLQRLNLRMLDWSRRLVAGSAILVGSYWLSLAV
jgi:nickel/cobalt exporter